MNETSIPIQSATTLLISFIAAIVLALIILITVIAPAEFGIDPTGLGKKMGLLVLAEAQQANAKSAITCPTGTELENWQDIAVITVPPASGLEYKFYLNQNEQLIYAWSSGDVDLYFDFHGEPEGDDSGYFKSYQESTGHASEGEFTAPFTGTHGWYWENNTASAVNIILKTKGLYQVKGLM